MDSGNHIKRIRSFSTALLYAIKNRYPEYELDDEKIDLITRASSLHDIGKIAIPDAILLKPARLTKEEYDIICTHPTKDCEILDAIHYIKDKTYLEYAYDI